MTIKHPRKAGNLYFTITGSPNPDKPELNRFEVRKCYHVIATWNADGMRIYINGKLDNSTSKTTVVRSTPGDVQIGAQLDENYNKQQV